MEQQFKPILVEGDKVMVPFWGLSQVTGRSQERVLGELLNFWHIRSKRMAGVVKYTDQSITELGIRRLMAPLELFRLAQQPVVPRNLSTVPAARRYQRWMRLLRSGQPGARQKILAEIIRIEKCGGRLLMRELELRNTVEDNFRAEVAAVLKCSSEKAAEFVKKSSTTGF